MNIPLLQQVKEAILTEPTKFDMSGWFQKDCDSPCGTAACIAGHGYAIFQHANSLKEADEKYNQSNIIMLIDMQSIFGITPSQAAHLFFDENWPDQFRFNYKRAAGDNDRAKMAKIAADRIDYLIATGQ